MRRQCNNQRLRREVLIYFKGFGECVKPTPENQVRWIFTPSNGNIHKIYVRALTTQLVFAGLSLR
jgi:hypothetical protein